MADGFRVELAGFENLMAMLERAPQDIQELAVVEIESAAKTIQGEAKAAAPSDFGILRNSIVVDPPTNNGLTQSVSSLADYSAYVEFGTGTKVSIAADPALREYEATFKTGKEVPGMYARPFFFPPLYKELPLMVERMKKQLDKIIHKV